METRISGRPHRARKKRERRFPAFPRSIFFFEDAGQESRKFPEVVVTFISGPPEPSV